jgi:hypothetical protein
MEETVGAPLRETPTGSVQSFRAELSERGFATAPSFFSPQLITEFTELFDGLDVDPEQPFFASCNDAERSAARRVDLELKARLAPLVDELVPGQVPFLGSFVAKGRFVDGPMDFHQDLTYVDERCFRSITVWVPLVDVDDVSGMLEVVPGSHRWSTASRPGGTAPLATAPLQEELKELAVGLPVKAGDVVVFDSALIHGSAPNRGGVVRPAVVVGFVPAEAQLVHFHQEDDGPLRCFEIDEAFFTTQPFRARPVGYPEIEPRGRRLDSADLAAAIGGIRAEPAPAEDESPRSIPGRLRRRVATLVGAVGAARQR